MEQIYSLIDIIVKAQKKARQENDYITLMTNAEALLEQIPALINYATDMESEYRKFEAGLIDEKDENGKQRTSSYCETKAKAVNYYKEWTRAKLMLEFIYDMVALSKKLASSVDNEFNAS